LHLPWWQGEDKGFGNNQAVSIMPFCLTRRVFLIFFPALASLLAGAASAAPYARGEDAGPLRRLLGLYLDTLLPEDVTPSATQLGVDRALFAEAQRNAGFGRLVMKGCAWLEAQARIAGAEGFGDLKEEARQAIVAQAEQSARGTLPKQFFTTTQQRAFFHYYAQPAAWHGIGYAGPPQPGGFPGHARPFQAPTP
jgi:hypothetical protein